MIIKEKSNSLTSKFVWTGFYYTADLAYRDAAGDYKLIGRKDDAIRTPSAWLSVVACWVNG